MTEHNLYKPVLSVVMSFYKEPLQWIRLSIESILAQTFRDFEFIIICDNPRYHEAIEYIGRTAADDRRIRLHVNESNIGCTRSLNLGISLSDGRYIARMDADDIAFPERFSKQVKFLDEHPEISICATDAHTINAKGRITRRRRYKKKNEKYGFFISNTIAHPSVMLRKSLLSHRNPLYDETYTYAQDYELWQFLKAKGHKFCTLQDPLLLYRKHNAQISTEHKQMQADFFRKAHRTHIMNWLADKEIICDKDGEDLTAILEKASAGFKTMKGRDRWDLCIVIWMIYYSLILSDGRYRLKYILDRNMIILRTSPLLTYRLLFTKKLRRSRNGLL